MKKWLVYVLGIITGIILTIAFAYCENQSNSSRNVGLEMFKEPGEYMNFSQFQIMQVVEPGYALANVDLYTTVLIISDDKYQFYDGEKIVLKSNQCAQRVGTFRYNAKSGTILTVPAVKIIDGVELPKSNAASAKENNSGKTFFDKPGDCVSRKNFKVQKVLESGDAIALEIKEVLFNEAFTSDLEVLLLAKEGSNYYDNQIVKAPKGKCAKQIGTYKYNTFLDKTKVIPIVSFE